MVRTIVVALNRSREAERVAAEASPAGRYLGTADVPALPSIAKRAGEGAPNLADHDAARASFSWGAGP